MPKAKRPMTVSWEISCTCTYWSEHFADFGQKLLRNHRCPIHGDMGVEIQKALAVLRRAMAFCD